VGDHHPQGRLLEWGGGGGGGELGRGGGGGRHLRDARLLGGALAPGDLKAALRRPSSVDL